MVILQRIRRFQRILRTKEQARDEIQRRLSLQREMERAMLLRLASLRKKKLEALASFNQLNDRTFSTDELVMYSRAVSIVDQRIKKEIVDLLSLRQTMTETEKRLVEQHQEVRKFEKFVENLQTCRESVERKSEQSMLDDLAGMLYYRRKREV